MSVKSKILAAAAAVALVSGASVAGALSSSAATPSCGQVLNCVDLFARDFGTHQTPGYVLDVLRQGAKVGQPLILFRTSNSDVAEDFNVSVQGPVSDFYAAGMVSAALALHYGCAGTLPVNGASIPCGPTAHDDWAFEVEYAPAGVDSGLCVGVASTAFQGEGVTLQPCGIGSHTLWIVDQADSSTGQLTPVLNEYVPLINGSDVNFSKPFVLTYPSNGFPTDKPRPQLVAKNLTGFSQPGTGDPQGVDSSQLWGADYGVLK